MSEKLQAKTTRHLGKLARESTRHGAAAASHQRKRSDWRMLLVLPAWVFVAFIVSQLVVIGLVALLSWLGAPLDNYLRPAAQQTVVALAVYVVAVALTVGVPYVALRQKVDLQLLGIHRLPSWSDIGLAPVGFVVYLIATTVVMSTVVAYVTGFQANQAQDIGFQAFGSQLDNALAFLTLVVLAPIAEELLFRGYLYGKLKSYIPTVVAAIATSLLFGLVHFAWNVGIDVFVLGLVLCALRSLTGSIWAGVLLHMIKNGIAYYLLFVSPLVGG